MRKVIWRGLAGVLIFTPLARGTVKVWSIAPVLGIIYTLVFWKLLNTLGSVPLERQKNALSGRVPSLWLPISVFAALAVISFVFSIYKHDSFSALLRLFAYIGVYYLIVNSFDSQMIKRLINLVIIIATGLSIYGFLQYFAGLNHSWWIPNKFLAATYVNHNHFAGYLELVIPAAIGMLFSRGASGRVPLERQKNALSGRIPAYRKLFLTLALIIMVVVFIFTQSRGAWISLAIALSVMNIALVKRGRLSKKTFFMLPLLAALIFAFIYTNREEIYRRVETINVAPGSETSLQGRLKIWQGALGMIREHPLLGVGIGDFDWGFYRYRPVGFEGRAVYAHNDYLHMAAEMGVFAPIIMLWIFMIAIFSGLKKENRSLALGCAAGILCLSLHGLVDFNFHIPANMLLFTVYLAIVMSKGETRRT